jgi:hypothetical protein
MNFNPYPQNMAYSSHSQYPPYVPYLPYYPSAPPTSQFYQSTTQLLPPSPLSPPPLPPLSPLLPQPPSTQILQPPSSQISHYIPPSSINSVSKYTTSYPMITTPNMYKIPIKELVLRPNQVSWARKAHELLHTQRVYIDTGEPGSGKTYIVLYLALKFGCPIFVICPPIMVNVWYERAREYGVRVIISMSYGTTRSIEGCQPSHPYLTRRTDYTVGGQKQISFTPTQEYLDLVQKGMILVCDEFHEVLGNNDQQKAVAALIAPIMLTQGLIPSKVGLLSGTPLTTHNQFINMLRLIKFIRANKLYQQGGISAESLGVYELINICKMMNLNLTNQICNSRIINKSTVKQFCYELYISIIKPVISGASLSPTNMFGILDIKNGFYNIDDQSRARLRDSIKALTELVGYDPTTGNVTISIRPHTIGLYKKISVERENAKIPNMVREAIKILRVSPYNKVVISINYTNKNLEFLMDLLKEYYPLALTGRTLKKEKPPIIKLFNEDPRYRVIIVHPKVAGVGIELDDKHGGYPRFMIVSPTHRLLQLHQLIKRIHRDGTQSNAIVRIFYGKDDGKTESKLLYGLAFRESLEAKSEILKGMLEPATIENMILPSEYESEYFD